VSDTVSYAEYVTYTIPYTLDNRVPMNGFMRIELPSEIGVLEEPDLSLSDRFYLFQDYGQFDTDLDVYGYVEEKYYIEGKTDMLVEPGNYQVTITNLRNPRSLQPTAASFVL
jgi:hypothetical protein